LLALLFSATALGASSDGIPDFTVRAWHQRDGAPSDEVDAVCPDRAGYLWVATPTGLARFDGRNFRSVPFTGEAAPADPDLNALFPDPEGDGVLLAPASGGLLRLKDNALAVYPLPKELTSRTVTDVYGAPDGAVWIAFDGGVILRSAGTSQRIFDGKDGVPSTGRVQIAHDGNGRTWFASGRWLARYDGEALVPLVAHDPNDPVFIVSARTDGPWVIADRYVVKIVHDRPEPVATIDTKTSAVYLQDAIEGSDGKLWLGSRSFGLSELEPGGAQKVVIPGEDVAAVMEDRSGDVWAGTKGGGLMRLKPGVLRRFDRTAGLRENYSLSVAEAADGTMWFANRDGGAAYVTEQGTLRWLGLTGRGWKNFSALSLAPAAPDGVWITSSRGLVRVVHTRVEQRLKTPSGAPNHDCRVTLAARDGSLWAAVSPDQLARLRGEHWDVYGRDAGIDHFVVRAIAEDAAGGIWLGGDDGRLLRFNGTTFDPVAVAMPQHTGALQAIVFDGPGECWIGTEQGGLLRRDARGVHALTKEDGLPSNDIAQIIVADGTLWCGSHAGIFHLGREQVLRALGRCGERVEPVVIGPDDGLSEATCLGGVQPACWTSHDGVLWFATRQGVVAIDPRKERAIPQNLKVQITSARGDDRDVGAAGVISIPPHARTVELRYSVLCLATPDRVLTRYRLAGYDDEWTAGGADDVARFTRIPPGKYRFEISAQLVGIRASEVTDSVPVIVEPSWSQSLPFKLLLAVTSVLLVALAVRAWSHRRLRLRLVKLEHESAIERERARIAQNIHDDLGAGLTRISLLTQSTRIDEGRLLLDKIYGTVSELTQSMQEIVWAVNPKNDDLERMANYLVEYAQEFLTDAGIRCRVHIPQLLPEHAVTAQFRHELFLSCKEALHNVVKHASATEVNLRIGVDGTDVRISIEDNGRGLPATTALEPSPGRSGNGLPNLHARMASLGGRLEISQTQPTGVILVLIAPLPPIS
jgi:signal transduction histidine kinase/ligand-binding sensor domain-containing protein